MSETILSKTNFVNLIISVSAEKDGKYLLVKEAKPGIKNLWNFPSGKVEVGEDLVAAAKREFLEETGYNVEIISLLSVYHYGWDDGEGISIRFNFNGKVLGQKSENLSNDVIAAEWKTLNEIIELDKSNLLRSPVTQKMVKDVIKGNRLPIETLYTSTEPIK